MGGDEDSEQTGPKQHEINMERKRGIVAAVKEELDHSGLIFSAPLAGLTVADMFKLRNSMPEGVKVMAVKNTLMRRALEGSDWAVAGDLTKGSNVWFFVNEEDIAKCLGEYEDFTKTRPENAILGGVLEGVVCDGQRISEIGKLPSKKELYQKMAIGIKSVTTRIARATNMIPTKVALAIKLAFAPDSSEEK